MLITQAHRCILNSNGDVVLSSVQPLNEFKINENQIINVKNFSHPQFPNVKQVLIMPHKIGFLINYEYITI